MTAPMVPVDDFKVHDKDGNEVTIIQVFEAAASLNREADDPEKQTTLCALIG